MPVTANPPIDLADRAPVLFYLDDGVAIFKGVGSPEGVIYAAPGAECRNELGQVFTKTTASSLNTGWEQTALVSDQQSGFIASEFVNAGNVGGGLDALHAMIIPAGALRSDGDWCEFYASGYTGANSDTKRYVVTINAVEVINTGLFALNNLGWRCTGRIIRISATAVKTDFRFEFNSVAVAPFHAINFSVTVNDLDTIGNDVETFGETNTTTTDNIVEIMASLQYCRQ